MSSVLRNLGQPGAPANLRADAPVSAMTVELRGGRIVRHLTVQAWDEASCS